MKSLGAALPLISRIATCLGCPTADPRTPAWRVLGVILALFLLSGLELPTSARAQATATAEIDSPESGAVLSGSVQIRGTADSPTFAAAELAFAYASDDTKTWFTLQEIDHGITNSELAGWDTGSISDGDYVLRLRVTSVEGSIVESTVRVQVRNYTSAEVLAPTSAPTKALSVQIPAPIEFPAAAISTPVMVPTPTALPASPVAVSDSSVYGAFLRGAVLVAVLVVALGLVFLRRQS
jgi:hypothetical protein